MSITKEIQLVEELKTAKYQWSSWMLFGKRYLTCSYLNYSKKNFLILKGKI